MTELLLKIFLGKKSLSPDNRESYGTFASIVGIFVNLLLSFGKMVAGLLSGSVGIIADSLNNFSDAGSSIVSLISFKIAAKPADRNHPFGHARIEYISSMIVSFIILLVGFELFSESVRGFFSSEAKQLEFSYITYVILGVSVLFKLWLAIFYTKISKKIDSQVIKASAQDSLFDCVATSAVLISSAIIELTDIALIDSIIGLGVSVVIIVAGLKMLNETKNTLLGEAPVEEIVDSGTDCTTLTTEIKSKLLSIPVIDVAINERRSPLMIAVGQTTASLHKCYSGEMRKIAYPSME